MIDVRGVTRRFDALVALEDASFAVHAGEIVALLGPNGAGKTTASRIIGGILAPNEGDVLVDGVSVREDANAVRARCGFVTDQPSLYDRMPLRRYLGFFARLYDVAAPDTRAAELAKLLGLDEVLDRKLGAFSRGMRQKVAIARALVHDPPVLLLDEPATALDPEMAQMLRGFIVSLRARHRAILLTTHDLDEAQRIADRVVVLYKGRVVRTGAVTDIRAAGRPRYTVTFAGDAAAARRALGAAGIETEPAAARDGLGALRFTSEDPPRTNPAVLRTLLEAGLAVVTLAAEERSLEDAYLSILAEVRR
ncbi:MAG TPA: ABC transporter ATP-binding protein [Candidatus Limnocylindria bacterium]|jgi:ABC-2 type transport system ATP-binding protein|nr:ABC transporter ATP-binding protein [Candidatus Limnocylindria bacterium]